VVACAAGCTFAVRPLEPPDAPPDLTAPADQAQLAEDFSYPQVDLTTTPSDLLMTGMLNGDRGTYSGSVNLTTEGVLDWVHWGRSAAGDVDRKLSLATPQGLIAATIGTVTRFDRYSTDMIWADGTPTTAATTPTGVFESTVGNQLIFSVPAGQTARTLRLYVIIDRGTSRLTATLSDLSAIGYTDTVTNTNGATRLRYTITARSGDPNATLNVVFAFISGTGSIDLQGATYY
jgi:hypothetical protein